jgi:A/G-specific adenine glycosylase
MIRKTPSHHTGRESKSASTAELLLTWYDKHRRDLPWRAKPAETADPYRVWLSEIMLQQTTVTAVAPYYRAFLRRWPDVERLASASLDEVCGAWAGLGYYSRARNLHRAAQLIVGEHGGQFPRTPEALRTLPGVGAYTAAAIAAIAFGEPVAAMDGNAERVVARLHAIEDELPKARRKLAALGQALVPQARPGDFAQALMDLGSAVCLPKRPVCEACPFSALCAGRRLGIAATLPRKTVKRLRPLRRGAAFVALDRSGAIYLERRPEKGLLGGMLQPPLTQWRSSFPNGAAALSEAPFAGRWEKKPGFVRHGFTHFELELEIYVCRFRSRPNGEGMWLSLPELARAPVPTVMRKAIGHALGAELPLFVQRSS